MCWAKRAITQPQDYTDDYDIILLYAIVFRTCQTTTFQSCKRSAQNVCSATMQNCPTCRVILCSLKCVSLHLYKRLHFVKVKYLYGAETRTLGQLSRNTWKSFEIWCWSRMEISCTEHVRNEVLQRVKEKRNIIQTIIRRKANGIGHILHRNRLLIHIIDG